MDELYFIPSDETVYWSGQPVKSKAVGVVAALSGLPFVIAPLFIGFVFVLVGMLGEIPFYAAIAVLTFLSVFILVGVSIMRQGLRDVKGPNLDWYAVTDKALYCSNREGWSSMPLRKGMAAYTEENPLLAARGLGVVQTVLGSESMEFYGITDAVEVCTIINDAIESLEV